MIRPVARAARPGACAALVAGLALGACQGAGGLAGGSPAGKPIAVWSIEGAPPEVQTALTSELAEAATQRRVELVGLGQGARYRMKGYLTPGRSPEGGEEVAFVFDVFDAQERRAKRVAGSSPIRAAGRDPWQGLDRDALRRLAARSMEEIAAFLSAPDASPAAPAEEPTG